MKEFKNKVAVICGSANGFGRALALEAAAREMKVVLADIDEPNNTELLATLKANGADAIAVTADLTLFEEVEKVHAEAMKAYGKCDLLINCVGILVPGPVWEVPPTEWEWIIGTNLKSEVFAMRLFMPDMIARGEECHVVNIASHAGIIASPSSTAYHATKFASVGLTEGTYMALQAKGYKHVGISVVTPAFIQTDLHNAERHRPERYAKNDDPYYTSATYEKGWAALGHFITTGLPIDHFATVVFRGIMDNQFYIHTHNDFYDAAKKRANGIINDGHPIP